MKLFRLLLPMVLVLSSAFLLAGDKKNAAEVLSTLRFSIVKDDNGKPVRNASVILNPVGKNGQQSKGGYELKTDSEGKTESDGVPYGTLRIQVLAHGFQTLEDDSEVFYQISQFYSPEHARGVRWDDPAFAIRWPDAVRTIADRDRSYPDIGGVEAVFS